ncbi:hypothetical protein BN8_02497 [Fibrisoma limi BUZ 3]|uniref:Uncharacterized protein n=1 Tax=Fibrisoma limi BUZ 3 TaxID=1185876 RepID=I2GHN0_9BACT|nr:hypothetical protein BN8_02497 [Fibrisoma limi BUZ 3]
MGLKTEQTGHPVPPDVAGNLQTGRGMMNFNHNK